MNNMAKNFMVHPKEHIVWFVESCSDLELSKTLFFFVLLQSLLIKPKDEDIYTLFECVFPILKAEWETSMTAGDASLDEFKPEVLDWDCSAFFNKLLYVKLRHLNVKVMICIFWRLAQLISVLPSDILLHDDDKWVNKIRDLFVFFASSKLKHTFLEHLHYLAAQCKISPPRLLSKFFTNEGVTAAVQSIRVAAMSCIDSLRTLWCHVEHSGKKNGNNATWIHFLGDVLALMDQQKTFILSDKKFLPSLFASAFSSPCPNILEPRNILVPQDIEKRYL
ncbi:hypothetical protein GLYMA_08G286950v4 [Glycine max]|nr:hypothetical protein GLYMA_08G286950v4 [Glycine max]KAH1053588.1 hypothetical protein GYH30_022719 [Glycine max]